MEESDKVKESYDKIAAAYHKKRQDKVTGAWNYYLEYPAMMQAVENLVSGKDILDIGCGTGILSEELRKLGGTVTGVDISEEMLKIAGKEYPNIKFSVANTNSLPFPDASFDIAVSSLVMHYIQNLQPAFVEISRILRPNGQFLFSMHHPAQLTFTKTTKKVSNEPVFKPYFNNDKYYWEMCGEKLLSFQHTFEDIIKNLKYAGFCLLDLVECRPDASVKDEFAEYELTSTYPTFCLFHARLIE